jgi:multiple sugar transport system substrate-binding protein
VEWMNSSPEAIQLLIKSGSFPSTVAELSDPAFADLPNAYFGGQKVNQVLLAAAKTVPTGFEYLPFQTYAQTIFADSVGQAYANHTDLNAGLVKWQDALVKYGDAQGFSVNSK